MKIFNQPSWRQIITLRFIRRFLVFFFTFWLSIIAIIFLAYHIGTWGKIYPGVWLGPQNAGNKTSDWAQDALAKNIPDFQKKSITLIWQDKQWLIQPKNLDIVFETTQSANAAYQFGRNDSFFQNLRNKWNAWREGIIVPLKFNYNQTAVDQILEQISQAVDAPAISSKLTLTEGKIQTTPSIVGQRVNKDQLRQRIYWQINQLDTSPLYFQPEAVPPKISQTAAQKVAGDVEKIVSQSLILKFGERSWTMFPEQIVGLLTLSNPTEGNLFIVDRTESSLITPENSSTKSPEIAIIGFDEDKLEQFIAVIAGEIDRAPEDAVFQFSDNRATIFTPSSAGQILEREKTKATILAHLNDLNLGRTIDLSVVITQPKIITSAVNNLGIKELIGTGTSNFRGSIAERIHNIKLASSKLNGILVPPGETFSFNNIVGNATAAAGFKQAYVISEGRTVLGDGGGVCQVSTTMFRAALNAGLPIVERYPHAYRVSYYEQGFPPGLDATVDYPALDLKFKNDTPGHILIQTKLDTANMVLTFNLYGTSDGRISTISKSTITKQTPPPDPEYRQDPTLDKGTTKQIDWSAWGANVWFKRTVVRNGEYLQNETFYSNYRPWQAVYLVGIKEVL